MANVPATWTDPKTGIEVREGDTWRDAKPLYGNRRHPFRTLKVAGFMIDSRRARVQAFTEDYRWKGRLIKGHLVNVQCSDFVKRFTLATRAPDAVPAAPPDAPSADTGTDTSAMGPTRLITIAQAQDVFARYLLDRADQYETDSPSWVGLEDAAHEVANGEAWADFEHGELDGDPLQRRVKSMARTPGDRPVDPKLGTDDGGAL